MLAVRSHFVPVNGIRLHVLEWGEQTQRPVLLIHGSCAHAQWWAFVAAALADQHRVLAVDLRGHGDSDWGDPPDYSIHTHASDIIGLAAALDLTDLRIVGHSLGGFSDDRQRSGVGTAPLRARNRRYDRAPERP
jgi:pimeloyl-ACP methyl ester carboxylesterase